MGHRRDRGHALVEQLRRDRGVGGLLGLRGLAGFEEKARHALLVERLRQLVDLNFDRLQLIPVETGQFIALDNIDYPKPPAPVDPLVVLEGIVTPEVQP